MKSHKAEKNNIVRIAFSTILSGIAIATSGLVYSTLLEPGWVDISSVSVILPRLHRAFDNYRIALISDLHMGTWMTSDRLAEAVKIVNSLKPDSITLTGDFVTKLHHRVPGNLIRNLRKLNAKDGIFAVLGNHDYWSNAKTIRQILDLSQIVELPNKVHTHKRGEANLHIAGVDDYWENKTRLQDVLDQLPKHGAAILLAHEPDFAVISAKSGRFDLQLSGHTHGGQVVIPKIGPLVLPMYGRKFPAGLYKIENMLLYTNRGLGTGHLQVRFNCRPEITLLTLHASMV